MTNKNIVRNFSFTVEDRPLAENRPLAEDRLRSSHVCGKPQTANTAFTLVELLVVVAIIAMLAALVLPAINAARESGRRVQCMNNQSQIALALLNYEGVKNKFPPLNDFVAVSKHHSSLSWIGFMLPFIEQTTAWSIINNDGLYDTAVGSVATRHPIYNLVLSGWHCPSSGTVPSDNRINYVGNAGGQNAKYDISAVNLTANIMRDPNSDGWGWLWESYIPGSNPKNSGIFFSHHSFEQTADGKEEKMCNCSVNCDYISAHDGTNKTILLSENIDAGHWIWERAKYDVADPVYPDGDDHRPIATAISGQVFSQVTGEFVYWDMEGLVGFCYPHELLPDAGGNLYQVPNYVPLDTSSGSDPYWSPLFINEGIGASIANQYRKARPSSNHAGIVMAAMCDRSVRVLKDNMDKTIFVQLCRPASGVLIDMKKLD